ncbi:MULTISPECIES: methylglyoxal synthase [Clostridia]|uniref:Methylglyoxal synthase n=2 Tax=Clostridia TaxID=186801 RepID=A0A8I0DNV3_9CLOT|nr:MULTISPECIES: methylglyoxal synthase [Clostridia]MBC5640540.1 methylglyoxal synthase [Clostridium lentum]MBC5654850.1 methylglyoxal synthase [Blautia lenta]MEE0567404.1 methylglyoxal synthase [Clostridium sp.]OKZ86266.1 MAG: methylglyoxal synthase [Clostridium sp. 29_15]CDB75332.1 methylglyoxal synthase [Clostridium sp. CAG:265]
MRIALIAHDKKKEEMIQFAKKNESILKKVELVSTGTTGLRVMENTNLQIYRYKSGPLGGDQQIGALVADHNVDMIIFLRDPLTSQPHEPDIMALLRLCDVYKVPLATNVESAQLLLDAINIKL